ncbi:MAG: hypothetical protein D4R39_02330 [Methylophilaceae bacterium]|nr:MAG: hypothetical protein D4R39_02330 [Methylophilaceae bacterium]
MARGRGGKQAGQVGKAYSNRTDMQGANVVSAQPINTSAQLPVATATGQPYGAATIQENSQKQLAMGGTQTPPPQSTDGAGQPQNQNMSQLKGLTSLNAPGDRNESLFHGMDSQIGGGGSEALVPTFNASITIKATALLNSLGADVTPEVAKIRDYLNASAANGAVV